MKKPIPLITVCLLAFALFGCKSWFYHEVPHEVFIESDPPGSPIEINDEYVGKTPLTVKIMGGHNGAFSSTRPIHTIHAYPVGPGQFLQTKQFSGPRQDIIPKHLYFNLSLGPVAPATRSDVNVKMDIKKDDVKKDGE